MSGQCGICQRAARGFGHSDLRFKIGDVRRYPVNRVFCSRRCQDLFHARYLRWRQDALPGEALMLNVSAIEQAALRSCLKGFGEAAGLIGFDKALGAYSEAEALQVIEAIVTGWTKAMADHHQEMTCAPILGLDAAHPFADLEDAAWRLGAPVSERKKPQRRVK